MYEEEVYKESIEEKMETRKNKQIALDTYL